jgi:DNA-binding CsgD family transcriptional regulator
MNTDPKAAAQAIAKAKARAEAARRRTEQAEIRAELAKTRAEHAQTRAEQAEIRTEHAKTRAEQAETRAEQAQTRAEQAEARAALAEAIVQRLVDKVMGLQSAVASPVSETTDPDRRALEELSVRQREVLQLLAAGHNTKQIAAELKISSKTVEYHRLRLMRTLGVHDLAGLVRFAVRVGLVPPGP